MPFLPPNQQRQSTVQNQKIKKWKKEELKSENGYAQKYW